MRSPCSTATFFTHRSQLLSRLSSIDRRVAIASYCIPAGATVRWDTSISSRRRTS